MFLICSRCGEAALDHEIRRAAPGQAEAVCPTCHLARPFRFRPLPVVTGASGSGKSTLAARLAPRLPDFFCFENDILWGPHYDTPHDGYGAFRAALLRTALNVNQSRVTTVLFTSAMPADLGAHPLGRYFDGLTFLVLSCPDDVLAARLRGRPAWRESGGDGFIQAMRTFNGHLRRARGDNIHHLDTSAKPVEGTLADVQDWLAAVLPADT